MSITSKWQRSIAGLGIAVVALVVVGLLLQWLVFSSSDGQRPTILTVIAGEVLVQDAGDDEPRAAMDGETLREGDRVLTGAESRAIITFFEGSTQELEPDTEVTIQRLDSTAGGGLLSSVNQALGTTWNNVLDYPGSDSEFEVETAAASGAVRDTMFQVTVNGATAVRSRQGNVTVSAQGSQQTVVPGTQSTTQVGDAPGDVEPAPTISELRIDFTGPGFLLYIDSDGLAAGCWPPGAPVNQIPLTIISDCSETLQQLSLLSLRDGLQELYLQTTGPGEFQLSVTGLTQRTVVCEEEASGQMEADQIWRAGLELDLVDGLRLEDCQLGPFIQTTEPPPAKIVLPDVLLDAISQGDVLIPAGSVLGVTVEPPTPTPTPTPTSTPTPTDTPVPPPQEPADTPTPTDTAPPPPPPPPTPLPTNTPTPTHTPTPTPLPTPTSTPAPTPTPTSTLKGVVLHATTSEPIPGAIVEVVGTGLSTTTDALGVFVITNMPDGTQTLHTSASGFISRNDVVQISPGLNPGVTIFLAPDVTSNAPSVFGSGDAR